MRADDLCWMTAVDLAAAIRVGEVSPVEVTAAVLDRIARVNPKINAYVTVAAESALAQARQAESAVTRGEPLGPLHGVPISFKDLTDTRAAP
jgi:Asp-tRNA(Asn)/Glu-tRNA(Gln) amidotransferase A subunit family amidase